VNLPKPKVKVIAAGEHNFSLEGNILLDELILPTLASCYG
jgi:hypothetical protein